MDILARLREAIRSRRGPRYSQVGFENEGKFRETGLSRQRYVVLGAGTFAILGLLLFIGRHFVFVGPTYQESTIRTGNVPPGFVHLLVAAPHSDHNFCKTMVSAAVVGYPSASLVGWGETLEDPHATVKVPFTAEIDHIRKKLSGKADQDIVIIVDGYTSWFQLRPQTLLDRYFEINRRANERLTNQLGEQAVAQYNLTQKIVFSAQKTCSMWTAEDPACYAVPPSTLSDKIYGSKTDMATKDDHSQVRPRFMNAGVLVGTAKELRALYKEVSKRMSEHSELNSPQRALSQIFGEQEVYREIIRRTKPKTWGQSFSGMFSTDPRIALFKQEHIEQVAARGKAAEFGIGLDYESAIGFSTESSTKDVAWLTAHNPFQKEGSEVKSVRPDIVSTLPPLFTFTEEGLDRDVTWETVPLLTNVRTGVAPVVIHHSGEKSLREKWWNKIWFQEHARTLYNAHIYSPLGPLAVAGNSTTTRVWWSPEDWRGGARNATHSWFRYDDICDGTENEVFRDGRGRWILPQDH